MTFITPVEITPGSASSWVDADVSASVPSGSSGVIIHMVSTGAYAYGVRKNGSTDDRRVGSNNSCHSWAAIGVDSNRILEIYVGSTTLVDIWLVGYFSSDDATFFTNAVDKSLTSIVTWTDINISSDTGVDIAIGAIFEVIDTSGGTLGFGLRKNGSTDNRFELTLSQNCMSSIIGVDGSEICEGYIENTNGDFFLVGYIKANATFNTNAIDLSLGSTGSWLDLSALSVGAIGGIVEVISPGSSISYGLRKNGSVEDIYQVGRRHPWGIVECDGSRLLEGKIEATTIDFFEVGIFTVPAGGGDVYSGRGIGRGIARGIMR